MQLSVLLITKARGQAHDSVHSSATTIIDAHYASALSGKRYLHAFLVKEHLKTGVSDLKHLNVFDNMTVCF